MCSDGYDGDQQDGTQRSQTDGGGPVESGAARPGDHLDRGHRMNWRGGTVYTTHVGTVIPEIILWLSRTHTAVTRHFRGTWSAAGGEHKFWPAQGCCIVWPDWARQQSYAIKKKKKEKKEKKMNPVAQINRKRAHIERYQSSPVKGAINIKWKFIYLFLILETWCSAVNFFLIKKKNKRGYHVCFLPNWPPGAPPLC